jgi:hypothetical protein
MKESYVTGGAGSTNNGNPPHNPKETAMAPPKKELYIMVGIAVWVVIALFAASESSWYGEFLGPRHFSLGAFIAQSVAWSSPALLFGGILLWWTRKRKDGAHPVDKAR